MQNSKTLPTLICGNPIIDPASALNLRSSLKIEKCLTANFVFVYQIDWVCISVMDFCP